MSAVLRDHFRNTLPHRVRMFMDDIETQSGMQIDIVHQPPGASAAVSMRCLPGKIRIEIPTSNAIHVPAALHELQHMERYLVEGVPAMGGLNPPDYGLVGFLDNPVEHLVIVPQSAAWGMREEASGMTRSVLAGFTSNRAGRLVRAAGSRRYASTGCSPISRVTPTSSGSASGS